jgi:hypothetical protein
MAVIRHMRGLEEPIPSVKVSVRVIRHMRGLEGMKFASWRT